MTHNLVVMFSGTCEALALELINLSWIISEIKIKRVLGTMRPQDKICLLPPQSTVNYRVSGWC